MNPTDAVVALAPQAAPALGAAHAPVRTPGDAQTPQLSFGELLARGVEGVEQKVEHANQMVRAFALDDSIPVHEVTIALEEARLAVELALQIRTRVVEGYREIMNMQL